MNREEQERKELLAVAILSPGGYDEVYKITLFEDGRMVTVFGRRLGGKPPHVTFSKVLWTEERRLKAAQRDKLLAIQGSMPAASEGGVVVKDSWRVVGKREGHKTFSIYYSLLHLRGGPSRQFVQYLLELAPTRIDLHSWS